MRACKIAGVEVILNNWFLVLIAVFAAAGMSGKIILVFSAVIWHELAHALMAAGLGYKVKQVELLPFGATARIERLADAGAESEIMIAAAGPLASMVLAALCYMGLDRSSSWQDVLIFYGQVNVLLAAFNLLPALPLDGGRILRAILSRRRSYREATIIVVNISKVIAILLMAGATAEYYLAKSINLTVIIAALFLIVTSRAETNLAEFRGMRILARKKAELAGLSVMPTSHVTATSNAVISEVIRMFGPEQYYVVHIVDKDFHLCGALTETELWEGLPERGIKAKVGELLK